MYRHILQSFDDDVEFLYVLAADSVVTPTLDDLNDKLFNPLLLNDNENEFRLDFEFLILISII